MSRSLRISFASGVAALAIAVLWSIGRRPLPAPAERSPLAAADGVDRSDAETGASDARALAARRQETEVTDRPPVTWWDSRVPNSFVPRGPDSDGQAVEVVDDTSGSPVPDALVFVDFNGEGPWGLRDSSFEKLVASSPCYRTDMRGTTAIRFSSIGVLVVAVREDRWGASQCDADDATPATIRLHANSDVVLRVLDERGHPRTGIPIRFGFKSAHTNIDFLWLEAMLQGTTGTDGTVKFEGTARFPDPSPAADFGATPEIAMADRIFWKIDRASIPREPIDCTLPAIGSLRVRIVDEHGSLLPLVGSGAIYFPTAVSRPEASQMIKFRDGVSDAVALSVGMHVGAQCWIDGFGEFRGEWEGPKTDGEEAILDLVVPEATTVDVTGCAAWSDGSAAAGDLVVEARYGTGNPGQTQSTRREVAASSEGTFHAKFSPFVSKHGPARLAWSGVRGDGRRCYSDFIELDLAHANDPLDIGVVVLRHAESLVVSGTVVDATSRPVPNASLMVFLDDKSSFDHPWGPAPLLHVKANDAGCFRLFAVEPNGSGRLSVLDRVDGWTVTGSARFQVGESDLRVVAVARGAVRGRLFLSPEIAPPDLLVAVATKGTNTSTVWNSSTKVGADGSFTFADLDPGVVRVGLLHRSAHGSAAPLACVEDVAVRSGEVTRDPRLNPIDLRGRVHLREIRICDERGAFASTGTIYAVECAPGRRLLEESKLAGEPVHLLLGDIADVVVVAAGFRTEWLRGVDGDRALTLRPSDPRVVTLHFRGLAEQRPGEEIVALIGPEDVPVPESVWRATTIDKSGDISFEVDNPGSYRIVMKCGPRGLARESGRPIATTPQTFKVDERDSEASFQIDVSK